MSGRERMNISPTTDFIIYIGANPEQMMMATTLLLQAVQVVQSFIQMKRSEPSRVTRSHVPRLTLRSKRKHVHIDLSEQTIDLDEVEREIEQELVDPDH